MKKVILILGTMLIFLLMTSTVYAETINEYEQEVIDLAKGVYEYNGVDYQVDPAYIDQLISYLSEDDVDLTAEQRDKVEQKAFNSVAQGVQEGYLIPVEEESKDSQGDEESEAKANATTDPSQGQATDTDEQKNTQSKGNNQTEKEKNNIAITESTETKDIQSEVNTSDKTSDKVSDKTVKGKISAEDNQATASQIPTSDDIGVIKNTGFDLSNSAWIVIGLGMLMVSGVYVTFRYNLFTQGKEYENNE